MFVHDYSLSAEVRDLQKFRNAWSLCPETTASNSDFRPDVACSHGLDHQGLLASLSWFWGSRIVRPGSLCVSVSVWATQAASCTQTAVCFVFYRLEQVLSSAVI